MTVKSSTARSRNPNSSVSHQGLLLSLRSSVFISKHSRAQGLFLCFPGVLERVKSELREEVSGNSSVSDVESDSDSPTEVNITISQKQETISSK